MLAEQVQPATDVCHCGSGKDINACCGPFLRGEALPKTAAGAMRSLYAAYVSGNADYIIATEKATTEDDRPVLEERLEKGEWLNFRVLDATRGRESDKSGILTFIIAYRENREDQRIELLHERSQFVREDGRWLYLTGTRLPRYRQKKKEPCWCGSGKMAKGCHA